MRMIDPHLHIDSRSVEDLQSMAIAGIAAVVSQVYYPHYNVQITPQTYFDYYDRHIHYEPARTKDEQIETFLGIGINMVDVPHDWEKVVETLPHYLKEERVVCFGEIGLEPTSQTGDLATQEEILKAQLEVARQHHVPVVFHTPLHEKEKWIEKYARFIEAAKIEKQEVLIDHATPAVVKQIWEMGCHAGITVQPWRNVFPIDAATVVVAGENLNRLFIDSDSSPKISDALAVPKAAYEMRKLGVKEKDIQQVVFENPKKFYNLSL